MFLMLLQSSVKTQTDRWDLFESRIWLVLAILVTLFLIGYMLIIIAKRVMVLVIALSAPSRLRESRATGREAQTSNPDPWTESSRRMSPVVFMTGSTPPEDDGAEADPDAPKEGPGETDGEGWKKGGDDPEDSGPANGGGSSKGD